MSEPVLPIKPQYEGIRFSAIEENWNYYWIRDKTNKKHVLKVKLIALKMQQALDPNTKEPLKNPEGEPMLRVQSSNVLTLLTIEEYNQEKRKEIEP